MFGWPWSLEVWTMLAAWSSAFGTIFAVVVALRLAQGERRVKLDLEILSTNVIRRGNSPQLVMLSSSREFIVDTRNIVEDGQHEGTLWTISVVNSGLRPAKLSGHPRLTAPGIYGSLNLEPLWQANNPEFQILFDDALSKDALQQGDSRSYYYPHPKFLQQVAKKFGGRMGRIQIFFARVEVSSTDGGTVRAKLPKHIRQFLNANRQIDTDEPTTAGEDRR